MSSLRLVVLSVEHELTGFDCGNTEPNGWLVDHALASQKADLARTYKYVALSDTVVAGYVNLTTGSIRPEAAPDATREGCLAIRTRRS